MDRKEYNKQHYEANKEEILRKQREKRAAKKQAYYLANKDEIDRQLKEKEAEKELRKKERYKRNNEKHKEKRKAWIAANRDKINKQRREKYHNDTSLRKTRKEYQKNFYHQNRDKIIEQRKELREKNPEYFRSLNKKWRENNPEKAKESNLKYYHKLKNRPKAESLYISVKQLAELLGIPLRKCSEFVYVGGIASIQSSKGARHLILRSDALALKDNLHQLPLKLKKKLGIIK